ncbi:MAG: NUDIX hydrolase [Deltaproteobacteria bacterium]|nr:NUDIX hydrolase [Deltaproteobacteria bacterium]
MKYRPENDDERRFLAAYRKKNWPRPAVTADVAAFALLDGALSILLVRRGDYPCRGQWALPGGFVDVGDSFDDQGEDIAETAARELGEETGIAAGSVPLLQLRAFGRPDRDPRTRIITVLYLATVPATLARRAQAGDDAAAAEWIPLDRLDRIALAFDHADLVRCARLRLAELLFEGLLAGLLLPGSFTAAQLRGYLAQATGRSVDARQFGRRLRRLVDDGVLRRVGPARPARYRYR